MIPGDVEQLEVQLVGLDLGRLVNDEAELAEDARDLALRLDQRMQRTGGKRPSRERDVASLAREPNVQRDLGESRSARGDLGLELLTDGIGERADLGPVLAWKLADAGEKLAQLAFAAEE